MFYIICIEKRIAYYIMSGNKNKITLMLSKKTSRIKLRSEKEYVSGTLILTKSKYNNDAAIESNALNSIILPPCIFIIVNILPLIAIAKPICESL